MLIRINNLFEFEKKWDPKIGLFEPASRLDCDTPNEYHISARQYHVAFE